MSKVEEGYSLNFLFSEVKHPARDDQEMLSSIIRKTGGKCSVFNADSMGSWLKCIEGAGILVSGRFHHSIAAACLGTRFIALNSNTPKMLGLMQSMGYPKPLLFGDPNLRSKLTHCMSKTSPISSHLDLLNMLCSKAQKNFSKIRKLCSRS